MGKNFVKEFISDEYKIAVQLVFDQALEGRETANFEFPLMTKAGVRIYVLLNATTRRDDQGNVIGVVGIGQDITGRRAQEREYTRLIDTANAPIFGVDTEGLVNVWNQCAMRLVGYCTNEVMGHSLVKEFITDDYKTAVQAVLDRALQGAETENFEFPLITKSGMHIEVLLNATARRDEQGCIIGVVGIGQDITARLAQENDRYRQCSDIWSRYARKSECMESMRHAASRIFIRGCHGKTSSSGVHYGRIQSSSSISFGPSSLWRGDC